MKGYLKMGKFRVREASEEMRLNGRVGKTGTHFQVPILEKDSEKRGKRDFLAERGKDVPCLMHIPL